MPYAEPPAQHAADGTSLAAAAADGVGAAAGGAWSAGAAGADGVEPPRNASDASAAPTAAAS